MQLFAILAKVDFNSDEDDQIDLSNIDGKDIVESILRAELSSITVKAYLDFYTEQVQELHKRQKRKDGHRKRTSVNSVKILRICNQINKELTQSQKYIVCIRVLEYIRASGEVTEQELDFANTVAESFNIDNELYQHFCSFIFGDSADWVDHSRFLYVTGEKKSFEQAKNTVLKGLEGRLEIIRIEQQNIIFIRYQGNDELIFNGQIVSNQRAFVFSHGGAVRTNKSNLLYYSDIIGRFLADDLGKQIVFHSDKIHYTFPNGKTGLHELNLRAESGTLFGIMGGSGTGKSTLLNILNGSQEPTSGKITINGIDLYDHKKKLDGVIGHVSQDDLLLGELTVFQNLYYNAKLCFRNLSEQDVKKRVLNVLESVGLREVRNLKVGTPLDKTISGGQRKRLNIALELIREPSVMFVDEPTSGLSSRDSDNIMTLLKELTLKGKLIFVVIHQPSSDIYKMFDRMLILDQGGYPVFDGNPIDAVVYFKTEVDHANAADRECSTCGNVNPELLFNILESKVVDEFGNVTITRKVPPTDWNKRYVEKQADIEISDEELPLPPTSEKPSRLKQLRVYFTRDLVSKVVNRQYVVLNLLEAPVLALLLAFFLKYYDISNTQRTDLVYSYYHNENLPQYLFIAVIVSLFLGLTVAAEEIIKDQQLLKREQFLKLSRLSYLFAKVGVMFLISAIQSALFVWVGHSIMEIDGLWLDHWWILFTTACFSNLLGLIISSSFNSAKVIYIVVPLMIIPQLLFSGVIVKFDKLNPLFSSQKTVPWIGDIMTSRWAYESIVVSTFENSPIENDLYDWKKAKVESAWKRDYWIPEMLSQLHYVEDSKNPRDLRNRASRILENEIQKELELWGNLECKGCFEELDAGGLQTNLRHFLDVLRKQYILSYDQATKKIDAYVEKLGPDRYNALQEKLANEALTDLVTNRREFNKLVIEDDQLIQKSDPYYQLSHPFFKSPFFISEKTFAGYLFSTVTINMMLVWTFNVLLFVFLYFDFGRKLMERFTYKGTKKGR